MECSIEFLLSRYCISHPKRQPALLGELERVRFIGSSDLR